MSEPEKNGLLDLVDEHDKAVARIGELVLERDRLQERVDQLAQALLEVRDTTMAIPDASKA